MVVMRRRGAPVVTATTVVEEVNAPSSSSQHTKNTSQQVDKSSMGRVLCIALLTVAIGSIIILALFSGSKNKGSSSNNGSQGGGTSLRQASSTRSLNNNGGGSTSFQGLILHTHLGAIRIHFTPELAGEASIRYIADVVRASSSAGQTSEVVMVGDGATGEGSACQKCKYLTHDMIVFLSCHGLFFGQN